MPGSILNSQTQQSVLNLWEYFEREKAHGGPLLLFSSVQERVADAVADEKVLSMWNGALDKCNAETWAKCVKHTESLIEKWYEREMLLCDMDITPIIINIGESSESESD